jgi:hypothetical protein
MSNVLSEEKRQQVIALGQLGWPLRRIEQETGVRRETAGAYLKAAGIGVQPPRGWGRGPPAKPANEVTTGSDIAKPANAASLNPKASSNKEQAKAEISKPANGVTTGFGVDLRGPGTGNHKPIVCTSACEPFREAIELGLRQGRNAMAIWQDLVSESGFTSDTSLRCWNVPENPLPLFRRVRNRAAACCLDGIKRVIDVPPKSYQNRYREHGGTPDTGTAMHPKKSPFSHHFSQLLNAAQELICVCWHGAIRNRKVQKCDRFGLALLRLPL